MGCRLWGRAESDTTEGAQQQQPIPRSRCQRRVLRGLPCPVCAGPLPRHSADPSILRLMSVQKGWAALSVPLRPDSPGGEQVCHSSGRRRAGVKFTSHSSLGSCAGLGLNPDSQRPAPHLQLPRQSLDLRPWRHTLRPVRFSPVFTPVGDPAQIPPPHPPPPRSLAKAAVSVVPGRVLGDGGHIAGGVQGLGPGSQAPPLSPLATAPWKPSWGWRAAVSSLPSRSTAFSICRYVGQDPPWGTTAGRETCWWARELWVQCPPPPSPDEGQGSTEHSRWSWQKQAVTGSPFPASGLPPTPVLCSAPPSVF